MSQNGHDDVPVTQVLHRAAGGDRAAIDTLLPVIYEELHAVAHRMMAQERRNHTLQTTALVHEAYVKLIGQQNVDVRDRNHFFAVAATIIRRILVDHARQKYAAKRGGGWERVTIAGVDVAEERDPVDVLALDEAMQKLGALSPRACEVVTMRYFGGLTMEQIAQALNVSPRTVADDWTMARAWLRRELDGSPAADAGDE